MLGGSSGYSAFVLNTLHQPLVLPAALKILLAGLQTLLLAMGVLPSAGFADGGQVKATAFTAVVMEAQESVPPHCTCPPWTPPHTGHHPSHNLKDLLLPFHKNLRAWAVINTHFLCTAKRYQHNKSPATRVSVYLSIPFNAPAGGAGKLSSLWVWKHRSRGACAPHRLKKEKKD